MTEYYLADRRAEERAKQRRRAQNDAPLESQNVKVKLLGDFLFASGEAQGCDPYNSVQGKSPRDTWQSWRSRR